MRERQLGMRAWVHTGNEVDIGLADVLSDFLDDPAVSTILLRAPGAVAPPAEATRRSSTGCRGSGKALVLPLGQSAVGRRALSHTGGLVARGNDVVTGLVRQAGAHIVGGLEEGLPLLAETLSTGLRRVGRRVGILKFGGLGILLADGAVGFEMPSPTPRCRPSGAR